LIINLIRHGKTSGNLEKRYIGRTDEPLCEAGLKELGNIAYPDCELVVASPMKRCVQTANVIYPDKKIETYDELRECDFGDFEGKNHIELSKNADYRKWLENGGLGVFPNGENSDRFRERSISGFLKAIEDNKMLKSISFVVHGGTIMSVLAKFAVPQKKFYDFMIENGHGFVTVFDEKTIRTIEKI
jgi:alpha-ribazole phosphatase